MENRDRSEAKEKMVPFCLRYNMPAEPVERSKCESTRPECAKYRVLPESEVKQMWKG